jgi:hypothetical protein
MSGVECRLRIFKNKVMRRILGCKREKVTIFGLSTPGE